MTIQSQEEQDRALAMLLAQEYDQDDYYAQYTNYNDDGDKKKPKRRKQQIGEDDDWNPAKHIKKVKKSS